MASILKIFGNAFCFGVIPKIPQFINLILLPFVTPYLTLDDYGIWGIVSSYSSFFLALAPLGLHIHLPNYYFEVRKWKIYWNHIFFLFLVSGVICSALYILFLLKELVYVPFTTRLLIGLFSCAPILLFATNSISSQLYPLLSKPLPLVLRNLVASLSSITVSFIIIVLFRDGYWGWIMGSMTSAVVAFLMFCYVLRKKEGIYPVPETNPARIKQWMKISFPVIPHAIGFMLLNSSSRIIMTMYKIPLQDVGIYSNGYMMGDYITVVAIALCTALQPQIQKAYRENRSDDYRNLFYLCQFTACVAVFLVSCWMPDIYNAFIRNENLHVAAPIASLTCYANVMMPFYQFMAYTVFITKNTRQLLWLVFFPGIINVLLCVCFIPAYGYWAAVFATLVSFWSQLLVPLVSRFHKAEVSRWLGSKWKLAVLFVILLSLLIVSNTVAYMPLYVKILVTAAALVTAALLFYRNRQMRNVV